MALTGMRRDTNALTGQEDLQLRMGRSVSDMTMLLPSKVVWENEAVNESGKRGGAIGDPVAYVKWRYDTSPAIRTAEGCLLDFTRQANASEQQIVDFVKTWGPLALSGWTGGARWQREKLGDWRRVAGSADAIIRLSNGLSGSRSTKKMEGELAELWRRVPCQTNEIRFGAATAPSRVASPPGSFVHGLASNLDAIVVSRTSVAYQRSLLAAVVSDWLTVAHAHPSVVWEGDFPELKFSRTAPVRAALDDVEVLAKRQAQRLAKKPTEITSFQVGNWQDFSQAAVDRPFPVQASAVQTTEFIYGVPSDTFLAIAVQLAAAVLPDSRYFVCEICNLIAEKKISPGPGKPAKYCGDECAAKAKVGQRNIARRKLAADRLAASKASVSESSPS